MFKIATVLVYQYINSVDYVAFVSVSLNVNVHYNGGFLPDIILLALFCCVTLGNIT